MKTSQVEDEVTGYFEYDNGMVEHFITTTAGMFEKTGHRFIIANFVNAIMAAEPLNAPAPEGINSVMLGNAIMLSSFLKQPVDMPIDADAYAQHLQALIQQSTFQKTERTLDAGSVNMSDSFNK